MPTRSRPPDYLRVVDAITARIAAGEWRPGDKLPTQAALAAEYETSVSTVKAALRILRERGLVEGQQGKAIYVANPGSVT